MTTRRDETGRVLCECCQTVPAELALGISYGEDDAVTVVLCDPCFTAMRPELDASGYHYAGKDFDEAAEDGRTPSPSTPEDFALHYLGLGRG